MRDALSKDVQSPIFESVSGLSLNLHCITEIKRIKNIDKLKIKAIAEVAYSILYHFSRVISFTSVNYNYNRFFGLQTLIQVEQVAYVKKETIQHLVVVLTVL